MIINTKVFFHFSLTLSICTKAAILQLPECGKFDAAFKYWNTSYRLTGSVISSAYAHNIEICQFACVLHQKCKSFNFNAEKKMCEMNTSKPKSSKYIVPSSGWMYVTTIWERNVGPVCVENKPCPYDMSCVDVCESPGYKCRSFQKTN